MSTFCGVHWVVSGFQGHETSQLDPKSGRVSAQVGTLPVTGPRKQGGCRCTRSSGLDTPRLSTTTRLITPRRHSSTRRRRRRSLNRRTHAASRWSAPAPPARPTRCGSSGEGSERSSASPPCGAMRTPRSTLVRPPLPNRNPPTRQLSNTPSLTPAPPRTHLRPLTLLPSIHSLPSRPSPHSPHSLAPLTPLS